MCARSVGAVCFCIGIVLTVDAIAQNQRANAQSAEVDEIVAFFENNLTTLAAGQSTDFMRIAFSEKRLELCIDFLRQLEESEIKPAMIQLIDEGGERGDLEFIEFLFHSMPRDGSIDDFERLAVSSLSNAGHYEKAMDFIESRGADHLLGDELQMKAASYAYLTGNDAAFAQIISRIGESEEYAQSLRETLGSRRSRVAMLAATTASLGIGWDWDNLLRSYRLGERVVTRSQPELERLIASANSDREKIRHWFCWGAYAAKDKRIPQVGESLSEMENLIGDNELLRRIWRPEILYLASATNDRERIGAIAASSFKDGQIPSAVLAALISAGMRTELLDCLNTVNSLSAEGADVCVTFTRKMNLSQQLFHEVENQVVQMQLAARGIALKLLP